MEATPRTLLLDDAGASLILTFAEADQLQPLFAGHGIVCNRQSRGDAAILKFPNAEDVLLTDSHFRGWRCDADKKRP